MTGRILTNCREVPRRSRRAWPAGQALNYSFLKLRRTVLHCTNCVTQWVKTMSQSTFTFRVEKDLKENFVTIAKSMDRKGAQLLRDYMRDFVRQQTEKEEHDTWFREQMQVGLEAANAGDVISAEEVEAEAAAWRENTRSKMRSTDS